MQSVKNCEILRRKEQQRGIETKGAAEMKKMNIPVGVSDFEEIRKNGYYYIDKSELVRELLRRTGTKVSLLPVLGALERRSA